MRIPIALAWLSLLVLPSPAQDSEAPAQETAQAQETDAARLERLCAAYRASLDAFWKQYDAVDGDDARFRFYREHFPEVDAVADELLGIAQAHRGQPLGFRALSWLLEQQTSQQQLARVHALLARDYLDDPQLESLLARLAFDPSSSADELLRTVAAKSTRRMTQGRARHTPSQHLVVRSHMARELQSADAEDVAAWEQAYGGDLIAELKALDPAALQRRIEQMLERVVRDYSDIPDARDSFVRAAQGDLRELRELTVGKPAPEIEGEDVSGRPMRLSDHRGKVVVLDFWGNW